MRLREGGRHDPSARCWPGPPQRPLQWVDARDLAAFVLDAALAGRSGPFNVVGRPGAGTIRDLLEECASLAAAPGTTLRWVDPAVVARAGLQPWTEIPIWVPPTGETAWLMAIDVQRALAAGLIPAVGVRITPPCQAIRTRERRGRGHAAG